MKTKKQIRESINHSAHIQMVLRAVVSLLCLAATSGLAQTYTIAHRFDQSQNFAMGVGPHSALVQGPDRVLYGTTEYGGYDPTPSHQYGGFGTVFKVNPDGSGFTVLKRFVKGEGVQPITGLVLSGTTLYGTAQSSVFKINTDGSGFQVLKLFTNQIDGAEPAGELAISGNTLYGTTYVGGSYGYGTLFKLNTDGSGFTVLKNFSLGPDSLPAGGLVLVSNTLYGTSSCWPVLYGLDTNYGCVFKINTDGTGYRVLVPFTGSNGGRPIGNLLCTSNTLYGTTTFGTLFEVNLDGSGFTSFSLGMDAPGGSLALSGSTIYGTTYMGGSSNAGCAYRINTDGTGLMVLKEFNLLDGTGPYGGVILSGTTLYGTTSWGGTNNFTGGGVLFGLSIAPPIITTPPQSQTAERGCAVEFNVDVTNSFAATYTWLSDETNLVSCTTNCWLDLTNCDLYQSGTYTVIVSNIFGVATSAPVMLNVIAVVERRPVRAINLTGDAGASLNVEFTDAFGPLANWLPLDSVNLTNPPQFCFDITTSLPLQRFYRAWQTTVPVAAPVLNFYFVPAITLTGNIGDSLRLDYINAIGPTDAWVTLDTITLTNASQLYFDTSSLGQPRRLYRIVPEP